MVNATLCGGRESGTDWKMIAQGHELVLKHQQHSDECILGESLSREVQHSSQAALSSNPGSTEEPE